MQIIAPINKLCYTKTHLYSLTHTKNLKQSLQVTKTSIQSLTHPTTQKHSLTLTNTKHYHSLSLTKTYIKVWVNTKKLVPNLLQKSYRAMKVLKWIQWQQAMVQSISLDMYIHSKFYFLRYLKSSWMDCL